MHGEHYSRASKGNASARGSQLRKTLGVDYPREQFRKEFDDPASVQQPPVPAPRSEVMLLAQKSEVPTLLERLNRIDQHVPPLLERSVIVGTICGAS
jgi:hypothetical protein